MTEFKQTTSLLIADKYQMVRYQSDCTGLTVIMIQTEASVIQCSIMIVTEPEDDNGCAHALEHLIINGSQKHPYRGVLNKLDENASVWTNIDHTVFKFSVTNVLTALPVFLDHVMFPLLSDEDYILDVHHIDGEGKDGGLVYEEMKDAYHSPYKRLLTKLMKEVYPDSAYSYDYCGSELALRLSASNTKVKEFHKKYYQPENMTIILTGDINHSDVLQNLTEFESEIVANRNAEPVKWMKPWQTVPPPPNYGEYNSFHSNDYPDLDGRENYGYMIFGWRGPVLSDANGLKELAACEILLDYLCWQKSAPLHNWLVDIDEPLAGIVSSNIDTHKYSLLRLELFHIPLEKMDQAKHKTLEYLTNIRTGVVSIDMDRIGMLLDKELIFEDKDSTWVHKDFTMKYLFSLYLETDEFALTIDQQWRFEQLSEETDDYWLDMFRKYFTDNVVIVNGIPVELKNEEIEEKQRIEKQREALGEQGLAEKARILEKAKKYKEVC